MLFQDRSPITGTHRTSDGYLAAECRIARTGLQLYTGTELGRPDMPMVSVYRDQDAVFAADALASAAHKPITLDHPAGAVTADRWKELAVGWTGGEVVRDGEFLRVPMMVADAAAIRAIEGGTRELSCGYTASISWTPGLTADGEKYDARQEGIRLNHVAIVPAGRAGSQVRFGDAALPFDDDDMSAAIEYARMVHHNQHCYLGDRAPAFDEAAVRASIVRDAGRTAPVVANEAELNAAYSAMVQDLTTAWQR